MSDNSNSDLSGVTVDDFLKSKWLTPTDLPAGGSIVRVTRVYTEMTKKYSNPSELERTPILEFEETDKVLYMNPTRLKAMAHITGVKELVKWTGAEVLLTEGMAPNGKPTVVISSAAQPKRGLKPAQQQVPDEPEEEVFADTV